MSLATDGERRRGAGYALALLFVINLLNFYDRVALAAVTEPVRKEFDLSDSAIGWIGTAFVLVYAAVGLPLGRLADRGNRPRLLAAGVAVWSGFTALGGAAWNVTSLVLARMGVGIGEAACSPTANSLIGDLFPPRLRARALSLFMLGLPLGVMLAGVVSGVIARAYGWRMALFVAAVPGLLVAILAFRLPDPPRGASVRPADGGLWQNIVYLLRIPTLRWIVITGALHNFNSYAINSFMPAYLGRHHGLDVGDANVITGLMLGGLGMVSLLASGVAADRAGRWNDRGRLILATVAVALAVPCVYAALMVTPGRIAPFIVWMGLGWALSYVYYSTVYATIHDVVPGALRGTAMSLYFFCMYVLGGAFGTALLGMLSDHMARRAMTGAGTSEMTEAFRAIGLHDAFLIVPVIFATLTVVLFVASRTVTADMHAIAGHPKNTGV